MNSQEELIGCLWQLTEALAPNRVRRLSIVRDGDAPSAFCAVSDLSDAVSETDHSAGPNRAGVQNPSRTPSGTEYQPSRKPRWSRPQLRFRFTLASGRGQRGW
jgi:hypothetical protein